MTYYRELKLNHNLENAQLVYRRSAFLFPAFNGHSGRWCSAAVAVVGAPQRWRWCSRRFRRTRWRPSWPGATGTWGRPRADTARSARSAAGTRPAAGKTRRPAAAAACSWAPPPSRSTSTGSNWRSTCAAGTAAARSAPGTERSKNDQISVFLKFSTQQNFGRAFFTKKRLLN